MVVVSLGTADGLKSRHAMYKWKKSEKIENSVLEIVVQPSTACNAETLARHSPDASRWDVAL